MKKQYPDPYLPKDRDVYYFRITLDGTRRTLSTGKTGKQRARDYIREYVDNLAAEAMKPRTMTMTFLEYAEPYYHWEKDKAPTCPHAARLVAEGKTIGRDHVIESRRLLDRALAAVPSFGALQMGTMRRAHVLDLRTALAAAMPPRVAQTTLSTVKVVLSEAAYRQDIDASPASAVGMIKYEPKTRGAFTCEEIRAILEACPGRMGKETRLKAFFAFLATTGTRTGEARALRWGMVDFKTRECRIHEAAKKSGTGAPKWDKKRTIYLPMLAMKVLQDWHQVAVRTGPEDFVFENGNGKMTSEQVVKDVWTTIMDAAATAPEGREPLLKPGTRWLTPHSLRHSLNSILLSAGVNTLAVAEFMGWTSDLGNTITRVQRGYTHLELLDLRKVADAIDKSLEPAAAGNIRRFA